MQPAGECEQCGRAGPLLSGTRRVARDAQARQGWRTYPTSARRQRGISCAAYNCGKIRHACGAFSARRRRSFLSYLRRHYLIQSKIGYMSGQMFPLKRAYEINWERRAAILMAASACKRQCARICTARRELQGDPGPPAAARRDLRLRRGCKIMHDAIADSQPRGQGPAASRHGLARRGAMGAAQCAARTATAPRVRAFATAVWRRQRRASVESHCLHNATAVLC